MEISKFWNDVITAYKQVATNHEREVMVESNEQVAKIEYVELVDKVVISIYQRVDDMEGDEVAADGSA